MVTVVVHCSLWWHCVNCGGTAAILFIMVPLWLYCVHYGDSVVTAVILLPVCCYCGHCGDTVALWWYCVRFDGTTVALRRRHCGGGTAVIVLVTVMRLRSL